MIDDAVFFEYIADFKMTEFDSGFALVVFSWGALAYTPFTLPELRHAYILVMASGGGESS